MWTDDVLEVHGWETGTGEQHLMAVPVANRSANWLVRVACHRLIDYLPDPELSFAAADLFDRASVYLPAQSINWPKVEERVEPRPATKGALAPIMPGDKMP